MSTFSFLLIAGGLVLVANAIRGTKPSSTALWGKDESGKPIKAGERISWAILGAGLILLGAFQIMNHRSN
jgi:hypothetical protein